MNINLGNRQWKYKRYSDDEITNFCKKHNLLDIAKYYHNSSFISSSDYRSLKEIYTSYYSDSRDTSTYNDDFLSYMNAKLVKNTEFGDIDSLNFSLSKEAVTAYFNRTIRSGIGRYGCTPPEDVDLVDKICWSDDSENDDISQGTEDFDTSMVKIGYNAIIQCIRDKQSIHELKRVIMQQDLVSKLEGRIRFNIYNNSGLIYNIYFIDSIALIRLLNSYLSTIGERLIKANVAVTEGIMIDDAYDVDDFYIICFIDTTSLSTSESHKMLVVIDSTLGYGNNCKNYSNIYHMIIDSQCKISYFAHKDNAEVDFLSLVSLNRSICIPFAKNKTVFKWLKEWKLKVRSEVDWKICSDFIIKSQSKDKSITCFLPVPLSDLTLLEEYNPSNDKSVKYKLKSIPYGYTKCLYYNLNNINIKNQIPIDDELINLIDKEISKRKLNINN